MEATSRGVMELALLLLLLLFDAGESKEGEEEEGSDEVATSAPLFAASGVTLPPPLPARMAPELSAPASCCCSLLE